MVVSIGRFRMIHDWAGKAGDSSSCLADGPYPYPSGDEVGKEDEGHHSGWRVIGAEEVVAELEVVPMRPSSL